MIDKIILNMPDIQGQTKLKTLDMSNAYSKSFMPETGGTWTRERGESVWKPNKDDVPKTSNPEGLTWKEIFKKYNIEGIPFKDGYPDFSEVAIETVEIDNFTVSRDDNFKQADQKLTDQWNKEGKDGRNDWTTDDVKEYRKENNLTWHEHQDMKTMQLVPSEIHNNVPHAGGISEKKKEDNQ